MSGSRNWNVIDLTESDNEASEASIMQPTSEIRPYNIGSWTGSRKSNRQSPSTPSSSRNHSNNHKSARDERVAPITQPTTFPTRTRAESNMNRRRCANCTEFEDMTCDGEQPCSACVEPGLICEYPDQPSHTKPTIKSSFEPKIHIKLPISKTNSTTMPSPAQKQKQQISKAKASAVTMSQNVDQNSRSTTSVTEVVEDGSPYDSTYDTDDSDVPLHTKSRFGTTDFHFEDIKSILKEHEVRMRSHREYLLQPLLNRAKLDASRSPGPNLVKGRKNPFSSLIADAKSRPNPDPSTTETFQLHFKSHKIGAPKKWTPITFPLKNVETDLPILPKYKSIGRLGTSILAPNVRTLKYWPYFPDDEEREQSEIQKSEELEQRYRHDDANLLAQRKCQELVDLWRPWIRDFISSLGLSHRDLIDHGVWTDHDICPTCGMELRMPMLKGEFSKDPGRAAQLSSLASAALKDVAKISMWHFIRGLVDEANLAVEDNQSSEKDQARLCSICFTINCVAHGVYVEPEDNNSGGAVFMGDRDSADSSGGGNVFINDEEADHNYREFTALPKTNNSATTHRCGLFCVNPDTRVKDILGSRSGGVVSGIYNRFAKATRPALDNIDVCSDDCFWPVEHRTRLSTVSETRRFGTELTKHRGQLFKHVVILHSTNQRAPCMIAREMNISCVDAFYLLLAEHQRIPHTNTTTDDMIRQVNRKLSKSTTAYDTTMSAELDLRPPFVPCSHDGPCLSNDKCSCSHGKVYCEWFCGCDLSCKRRYQGCSCSGSNKVCFNDNRCECWSQNRECDPWLCMSCGVVDVLDPANKYNDDIRRGRCKNNVIQLDLPARTIKAPSDVQGWGLFAGKDLSEHTFIGEYKGEIVGNQESDRRGAVYSNIGQEYLFVMNQEQQIDGSNFGNKTRFMNNSQRDEYINVVAKKLLSNGIQRVMMYTKRPVKAGEELLYNYNYPAEVVEKFWEKGEIRNDTPGKKPTLPSVPVINGHRYVKQAGEQANSDDKGSAQQPRLPNGRFVRKEGSRSPSRRRDGKRKRVSEGESFVTADGVGSPGLEEVGDSEDSVYDSAVESGPEVDDEEDEDEDEDDDEDEDEDDNDRPAIKEEVISPMPVRKRQIHPKDGRIGGMAQKKAWETRKTRAKETRGK